MQISGGKKQAGRRQAGGSRQRSHSRAASQFSEVTAGSDCPAALKIGYVAGGATRSHAAALCLFLGPTWANEKPRAALKILDWIIQVYSIMGYSITYHI